MNTTKTWGKILPWALLPISLAHYSGFWLPFHSAKWLALYAVALAILPLLFFKPVIPKLSKWEWIGFLSVALLTLVHLFWFRPNSYEFSLLDRVSFLILLYAFWRAFSDKLSWSDFKIPLATLLIILSGVGLFQFLLSGKTSEMPYFSIAAMQGHANLASQLVGLSLVLFLSIFSWNKVSKSHQFIIFSISFISTIYLLMARGRSVVLALLGIGFLALILNFRKQKVFPWKKLVGAFILVYAAAVGLQVSQGFPLLDSLSFTIFSQKSPMVTFRADVWAQTLKMIQAYPLGVGVDRFIFSFIPFHKEGITLSYVNVAANPHNEFLRYLAEDGIGLSILFLGVFLWWGKKALAKRKGLGVIFLPVVFILFEMMFQFPLLIAPIVFLWAAILGFVLSQIYASEKTDPSVPINFVMGVMCLVFVGLVSKAYGSRFYEKSTVREKAKISCEWAPGNWNGCLQYARILAKEGALVEARMVVEQILERDPWNYAAIRHLAYIAMNQGDRLESCFHTWKYDDLFKGNSGLQDVYQKNCPKKWRDYFERKRPVKYYGRPKRNIAPEKLPSTSSPLKTEKSRQSRQGTKKPSSGN